MIYILRTLLAIGAIPIYLTCCLLFAIGFFSYPIIGGIYYIIHGENDTMKWEIDTMANLVSRKYNKIKEQIEKLKRNNHGDN